MEDLPCDIQSKILSDVPHESVLDCKIVSKTWKTLLSHRKLAGGLLMYRWTTIFFGYYDEILSHKGGDDNNLFKVLTKFKHPVGSNMIGSCNGLVCLFLQDEAGYYYKAYVFNPVTGEGFKLPTIEEKNTQPLMVGFGYCPSRGNYKVVRIQYLNMTGLSMRNIASVQVHSLGGGDSSGWRNIGEINYRLVGKGIFWNGCIHWLDRREWDIVAFDLAEEEFRYLPTTPASGLTRSFEPTVLGGHLRFTPASWLTRSFKLTVLGGYLSFVIVDPDIKRINIYMFKNKKNDDPTVKDKCYYTSWDWSLEFSIPFLPVSSIPFSPIDDDDEIDHECDFYEPLGITKNNEVFLWCTTECSTTHISIFCLYDTKTDTLIKVSDGGDTTLWAIPHVNTFVSLKDLGVDSETIDQFAEDGA